MNIFANRKLAIFRVQIPTNSLVVVKLMANQIGVLISQNWVIFHVELAATLFLKGLDSIAAYLT